MIFRSKLLKTHLSYYQRRLNFKTLKKFILNFYTLVILLNKKNENHILLYILFLIF